MANKRKVVDAPEMDSEPTEDVEVVVSEDDEKPAKPEVVEIPLPDDNETSVVDALQIDIQSMRKLLRRGETISIASGLLALLPDSPVKGYRRKLFEWRSFVVWAEYNGKAWKPVVYIAGKLRQ